MVFIILGIKLLIFVDLGQNLCVMTNYNDFINYIFYFVFIVYLWFIYIYIYIYYFLIIYFI